MAQLPEKSAFCNEFYLVRATNVQLKTTRVAKNLRSCDRYLRLVFIVGIILASCVFYGFIFIITVKIKVD